MKIRLTSVYVDDQEQALRFYTDVLGFAKKADVASGPYRWLTVASSEEPEGTELQLALNDTPAARAYQQAMLSRGNPPRSSTPMTWSASTTASSAPVSRSPCRS